MTKRTVNVRTPVSARDKFMMWKRELSVIEGRDIPLGEILERMSKGDDTLLRLKKGSLERNIKR